MPWLVQLTWERKRSARGLDHRQREGEGNWDPGPLLFCSPFVGWVRLRCQKVGKDEGLVPPRFESQAGA